MRNISDKVAEDLKTNKQTNKHCMFDIFFPENRAVYKIMWQKYGRSRQATMTIWRIRFACWIPKATNTHSQCATLTAFPLHSVCMSTSQCSVIRTLQPVWLHSSYSSVQEAFFYAKPKLQQRPPKLYFQLFIIQTMLYCC
jgi:hypothetical protein